MQMYMGCQYKYRIGIHAQNERPVHVAMGYFICVWDNTCILDNKIFSISPTWFCNLPMPLQMGKC